MGGKAGERAFWSYMGAVGTTVAGGAAASTAAGSGVWAASGHAAGQASRLQAVASVAAPGGLPRSLPIRNRL
jgi:hypothetical protein